MAQRRPTQARHQPDRGADSHHRGPAVNHHFMCAGRNTAPGEKAHAASKSGTCSLKEVSKSEQRPEQAARRWRRCRKSVPARGSTHRSARAPPVRRPSASRRSAGSATAAVLRGSHWNLGGSHDAVWAGAYVNNVTAGSGGRVTVCRAEIARGSGHARREVRALAARAAAERGWRGVRAGLRAGSSIGRIRGAGRLPVDVRTRPGSAG